MPYAKEHSNSRKGRSRGRGSAVRQQARAGCAMTPPPYPDVFGESRYFITSEHMKAFRARLLGENRSRETAAYHPSDRRRILDSDEYCWRFIVHNRLDLERAVRMADAALKWRAQVRLHELTESSLPRACLQAGFVHPFNMDRYGNHVLLLRPTNIRNLPMIDVRRVLVFFVETLLRRQNASRITLLVDCVGGDRHQLELGRYLMALFRCYYPRSLGFVLLWHPPRLLQGIWKLCKGLMPVEALERVRFVTVRDIGRYVDRDKLPVRMGGTDNYHYVYVPGKPLGERCPKLAPLDPVSCPTASLHVYGMFTA